MMTIATNNKYYHKIKNRSKSDFLMPLGLPNISLSYSDVRTILKSIL